MSTSAYYNFIGSVADKTQAQVNNAMEIHRQAAMSPSSFATSSSNSNSSLNQYNSFMPTSTASSSTVSSSSASSTSSTNSITAANFTTQTRSLAMDSAGALADKREFIRQFSVTPSRMHHPQLSHSYTLHSLEPKPLKPFKSRSEYLEAMKEDLAEWLNRLYSDLDLNTENFFSQLESGAIICRHANNVTQMGRNSLLETSTNDSSGSTESSLNGSNVNILSSPSPDGFDGDHNHNHLSHRRQHRYSSPSGPVTTMGSFNKHRSSLSGSVNGSLRADQSINWFRVKMMTYKQDARPGTFFARDNICQFILWCRSLNILECLLFETDDLAARKNDKSFILCLLEVARIGFKVGMPTPLIIQLEQEIDREIENDVKLQKQLYEEEGGVGQETNEVVNNNTDHSDESVNRKGDYEMSKDETVGQHLGGKQETNDAVDTKQDVEDDYCDEDYGPKPQVITNDLLSLHERVVQLLCQCTCPTQFPMVRIGDGKYKVGDKLIIFVRILRRHIMVRVGGGWQELSEFLRQKDPCRTRQHQVQFNQPHCSPQQAATGCASSASRLPVAITHHSTVSKSRLVGSSHYLNKAHHQGQRNGSQRSISGSASMSWLSHN